MSSYRKCDVCHITHQEDDFNHNSCEVHRFNFLLWSWNNYRKALVKNRHGVEITARPTNIARGNNIVHNFNDRKGSLILRATTSQLNEQNDGIQCLLRVKNNLNADCIHLMSANLLFPLEELFTRIDPQRELDRENIPELEPRATYDVIVKFKTRHPLIGTYKMPIAFNFQTTTNRIESFTIAREVAVIISDETVTEDVNTEKSPFTNIQFKVDNIIGSTSKSYRINDYPIPREYRKFLKYGIGDFSGMTSEEQTNLTIIRELLHPNYCTQDNYADFFHIVLWLEEKVEAMNLRLYNMENVTMKIVASHILELAVPGLAEKRPSLIQGDEILIRLHDDHTAYYGVVARIFNETIHISDVDPAFFEYLNVDPETELDVKFVPGRLIYERQHQAIDLCVSGGMLPTLFPSVALRSRNSNIVYNIGDNDFINEDVANNAEQKKAVINILNCTSKSAPYIVFGPPGTGKTITIVEAMLQIKNRCKDVNILVCAPANAACDMLTSKLIPHCKKDELIRVHAKTRDWKGVPKDVQGYSNYAGDSYTRPTGKELMKYRIVIATLMSIGRYAYKYHPHFVFIDEAAQALEPEAAVAISLMTPGKQLVLTGDPKQLAPICTRAAEAYSLNVSLLERLMLKCELYQDNNPNFITMLKLNFRAHPSILHLPNKWFYNRQLEAKSFTARNDPIANVSVQHIMFTTNATTVGQPVEFYAVYAKEKREGRSPSYFNWAEIELVVKYVNAFISLTDVPVEQQDIGIISPYIRQVYKIKDRLTRLNLGSVEVGTTEAFQGREKRIMIISTVRAQHNLVHYDRKYNLGFVGTEKRLNVALTRAKSKLVVIGCPLVLGYDEHWLEYIEFCRTNNSYYGAAYRKRDTEVRRAIVARFSGVNMKDTQYSRRQN